MFVFSQLVSMKKICILFLFVFLNIDSNAQNITGYWQGYYVRAGLKSPVRSFFFMDIKQAQKALWGVYNTYTSSTDKYIGCLCSVTGLIPKGEVSVFDLYKESIIDFNPKFNRNICDFLNKMTVHYVVVDSLEYLVGKWYTANSMLVMRDGSEGVFVLKHVALQNKRSVDQYFPKLDKLLDRGTTSDTTALKKLFLLPDNATSLTDLEKDLINALRNKPDIKE